MYILSFFKNTCILNFIHRLGAVATIRSSGNIIFRNHTIVVPCHVSCPCFLDRKYYLFTCALCAVGHIRQASCVAESSNWARLHVGTGACWAVVSLATAVGTVTVDAIVPCRAGVATGCPSVVHEGAVLTGCCRGSTQGAVETSGTNITWGGGEKALIVIAFFRQGFTTIQTCSHSHTDKSTLFKKLFHVFRKVIVFSFILCFILSPVKIIWKSF